MNICHPLFLLLSRVDQLMISHLTKDLRSIHWGWKCTECSNRWVWIMETEMVIHSIGQASKSRHKPALYARSCQTCPSTALTSLMACSIVTIFVHISIGSILNEIIIYIAWRSVGRGRNYHRFLYFQQARWIFIICRPSSICWWHSIVHLLLSTWILRQYSTPTKYNWFFSSSCPVLASV